MTTQLRPRQSHYGDAPPDYALLNAYPEIWEPLPDTGMQERPQQQFKEALRGWYGRRPDVFVSGNTGVYYEEGNSDAVFLPDCYVVFGEGADRLWYPYAYRIWEFGHPPAFALEIASQSTYLNDLGPKRELYARVGIQEYWRYDPTGGEHYGYPLIGEYLEDGEYRQFELHTGPNGLVWAYSPTLQLELRWIPHELQLRDPATGRILGDVLDEIEARQDAEARSIIEREGRLEAEAQALIERERRRDAEAEIAQLQAQLRELRGE